MAKEGTTAEGRYLFLEPEKTVYLDRGVECAKYTLPTLITENDKSTGKNTAEIFLGLEKEIFFSDNNFLTLFSL